MADAHAYRLDEPARRRGVVVAGDASHLLSRLDAGKPVQVGILGSSVGEQGGCLGTIQPGKQCSVYSGIDPYAKPGWGLPRRRSFAGFLVRMLHWINATWPHQEHGIFNGAMGAKPLAAVLPCLDLHAPPRLDLVVIEPLSSGVSPMPALETVIRLLLSRRPRPTIVVLGVSLWYENDLGRDADKSTVTACSTNRGNFAKAGFIPTPPPEGAGALSDWQEQRARRQKARWSGASSSIAGGQQLAAALCQRYGLSCLSMHSALAEGVRAGRPGFSMAEVAGDCLHPLHGTLGTEYVTDVLVEWLSGSRRRHQSAAAVSAAFDPLPPPMSSAAVSSDGHRQACYTLDRAHADRYLGGDRDNRRTLPWYSVACPPGAGGCTAQQLDEAKRAASPKCPKVPSDEPMPSVWFFCLYSMAPGNRKRSPGVVAMLPAATLFVPLRPHEAVGASDGDGFCISVWHLTSYEQMGVAMLRCAGGCRCEPRTIDAHRPPAKTYGRNVSVYWEHTVWAVAHRARDECVVQLRVDERTESGGHKFKVSEVNLRRIGRAPATAAGDAGTCQAGGTMDGRRPGARPSTLPGIMR